MLRKLLDNTFLSQYSLQGFKGKKAFKELALCNVIIGEQFSWIYEVKQSLCIFDCLFVKWMNN